MEFNRLSTFLPEKEDWRNAELLSLIHNVNVKSEHHKPPSKFMPRSVDQIIEDEIAAEEAENNPQDAREAAIHEFNSHVAHLKSIGRPTQTIKV